MYDLNYQSDVILMIVSAMGEWAKNTFLRFQEADNSDDTLFSLVMTLHKYVYIKSIVIRIKILFQLLCVGQGI